MKKEIQKMADKGRMGDSVVAHLTPGEIVLPREVIDDPEMTSMLKQYFIEKNIPFDRFVVGTDENSINPETGMPEFGWWKKAVNFGKKALGAVAPLALMAVPGIGTALGSAILGAGAAGASTLGSALIGAGTGALSGGGLKGALTGAALGGIGGNLGGIGQQTLGLSGTQSAALSGALQGAGSGIAAGGGLKGALIGAGLGGAGNYALAGGLPETLGTPSGVGATGPVRGTGVVGSVTRTIPSLGMTGATVSPTTGSPLTQSGTGGTMFNRSSLGNIASTLMQYNDQEKLKEEMLKAQQRMEAAYAPYAQAGTTGLSNIMKGFDPGDITQNSGYQFRLAEGQKALERSLAARGMANSGAALKAAQEYGQNLAAEEYDNAYRRWYQENANLANAGQAAAGNIAPIYGTMGDIKANATTAKSNLVNRTLSQLLGGSGNMKQVGVAPDGRIIYQDDVTGEISYGS